MTQDEIIRMAREARVFTGDPFGVTITPELERFAALVAAHEREKWEQALPIAMDAMMLQEREACAKVCETDELCCKCGDECAAAIRARNNND